MRKWISYSFIWLAALLLLGHSLVPHVHEKPHLLAISDNTCHENHEFGLLGKLFSIDIGGENHLDNFLSIHQKTVDFSNKEAFIFTHDSYFTVVPTLCFENSYQQKVSLGLELEISAYSQFFQTFRPLRAPPIS